MAGGVQLKGWALVAAFCTAHVLSILGFAAFAALLPGFFVEWGLSSTQAGWIGGIYFAGYAAAVLVLTGVTDRIDPRRVYIACALLGVAASLGFAWLADGFWSALVWRMVAGIAVAGTYMPGLKAMGERLTGLHPSRALAVYTAMFGLGASLSYLAAGELGAILPWRTVFALLAAGPAAAALVIFVAARPHAPAGAGSARRALDLRPVLRNRAAMAYILAYGAHCWELMGMRAWIVAYLVFSETLQRAGLTLWSAAAIAALANLIGVAGSILGNELCVRLGRRRVVVTAMLASALLGCVLGFGAAQPHLLVAALAVIYGLLVMVDSASIIAGAVIEAPADQKGATMAVLSFVGFTASFLGPLAFGVVLDLAGGRYSVGGWGWAFALLSLGGVCGVFALGRAADRVDGE
ncbi:MAG: MFS transporter [Rhodospirillaceae bacterium]|nr:MFS transporter [Rhodospirillaceae bacterium]